MTRIIASLAIFGLLAATAPLAAAQTAAPAQHEWTRRLTLNGFAGGAYIPPDPGLVAGGGVGWGLTRRWIIEGSAEWLNLPPGASAYAASLSGLFSLSNQKPGLPYVKVGVGMYAASYDTTVIEPPDFYARRISPGIEGRHSFRDPSVVLGGGAHVVLTRGWALRPEVEVTIALDGGHAYAVTSGVIRVAYYFERHQVTPDRTRR